MNTTEERIMDDVRMPDGFESMRDTTEKMLRFTLEDARKEESYVPISEIAKILAEVLDPIEIHALKTLLQ